jgi:hypothetical protein
MRTLSIMQTTAIATWWALFGISTGCGLTAVQIRERDLCYERADAAAQGRVDRECSDSFAACPTADAIMDELRRAQEACP